MMEQYQKIRSELPSDTLLLFRLGDFYEMFFEDAKSGSAILNVALTKRGDVPMCGIPYHAASGYLSRILKAGRKAAICDQVEEARPGKLVRREVTQIISPGAHFDERLLHADKNNFIACVLGRKGVYGFSCADLTTGLFRCSTLSNLDELMAELERIRPSETIHQENDSACSTALKHCPTFSHACEGWMFDAETARHALLDHFQVKTLDGFGLGESAEAMSAAGALLQYLTQHLRRDVKHMAGLQCHRAEHHLAIDATSLRNLEILEPLRKDRTQAQSLFMESTIFVRGQDWQKLQR